MEPELEKDKEQETDNQISNNKSEELTTNNFDLNSVLENEEAKKQINAYVAKQTEEAVKQAKKDLLKQYQEEKRKAELSREELLKEKELELKIKELKLEKISYFKEKGYDLDLVDFVIGEDITDVINNTETLMSFIDKQVEIKVNERLKQGYIPPKDQGKEKEGTGIGLKLATEAQKYVTNNITQQNKYFD